MDVIYQGLFANAIQLVLGNLNWFLAICIAKDVIKTVINTDNGLYYYLHVYITCTKMFFSI